MAWEGSAVAVQKIMCTFSTYLHNDEELVTNYPTSNIYIIIHIIWEGHKIFQEKGVAPNTYYHSYDLRRPQNFPRKRGRHLIHIIIHMI